MVFTTDVGGDKLNNEANWNKNKPKPGSQILKFTGTATLDSVLNNKVITSGTNQDGQPITVVEPIPSFISVNHYANWANSFRSMGRKLEADFIPIAPCKSNYGMLMLLVYFIDSRMLLTRKKTTTEIKKYRIEI